MRGVITLTGWTVPSAPYNWWVMSEVCIDIHVPVEGGTGGGPEGGGGGPDWGGGGGLRVWDVGVSYIVT